MHCPKCNAQTEPVAYQHITIDRCSQCKGIWFDMLEHEDLQKLKGSEIVDIGDPDIGRQHNQKKDVQCPKCRVNMLKLSDPGHPEVEFEKCPVCHGAYFDAGEFRLLKESAVGKLFRQLFKR